MEDKRRCHRLNIELPASFQNPHFKDNVSLALTFDISAVGVSFMVKEKPPVGQKLPINIMLPSGEKITLTVEVVWIEERLVFDRPEFKVGAKILGPVGDCESKFVKYYTRKLFDFFGHAEREK